MSKRKKGVSLDEKRQRILKIYHESMEVYNLKEIEKIGAKAGVGKRCVHACSSSWLTLKFLLCGSPVLQTIKDVNQALVDDGLVDFDKVQMLALALLVPWACLYLMVLLFRLARATTSGRIRPSSRSHASAS